MTRETITYSTIELSKWYEGFEWVHWSTFSNALDFFKRKHIKFKEIPDSRKPFRRFFEHEHGNAILYQGEAYLKSRQYRAIQLVSENYEKLCALASAAQLPRPPSKDEQIARGRFASLVLDGSLLV